MSAALHESALDAVAPAPEATPAHRVVLAIARIEARRLLRSPLVWLGALLTVGLAWMTMQFPEHWSGARYTTAPALAGPLVATLSFAVAGSFHRERSDLGADTPVGESVRAAGRLIGALSLVLLVALLTAAGGILARAYGGFDLGDEPGRTLHAHFTWSELLQPVALAVLAVTVGAAAGRRFRHRAAATLTLFVGWFPFVMVSWAFQSASVTPFSIVQIQPVSIPIGPIETDPLSFPAEWLLLAPGEFQDHWARAFVSAGLGAWHDLWLLGLAAVFVALALPGRARPVLIVTGALVAALGVAMQYATIP